MLDDDVPGALQRHGPPAGSPMTDRMPFTLPALSPARSSVRSRLLRLAPSPLALALALQHRRGARRRAVRRQGHPRRGPAAHRRRHRVRGAAVPDRRHLHRREGRRRAARPVRDRPLQGRAHRHRQRRRRRHRRRARGHRQHRLRRHEGVREGRADQVAEGLRHRRGPAVRQGARRPRRAGAQAPVPDAQPLRRRGRHDRDAAGAQPRQRHVHGHRGRAGEDPRDPHRRQQGLLGRHAEGPVRAQRRRLAQLLPEGRPLLARQAQRRPGNAARLLPEPRLPRVRGRVDAGRDLARQAGHHDHDQRQGRPAVHRHRRQARRRVPRQGRRVQARWSRSSPGEPYRAEAVAETTRAFVDRFGTFGYAFAKVDSRPEIDRANGQVVVTLAAEPQRRVYVRRVNVAGNTRTRDEVVRREFRQFESSLVRRPQDQALARPRRPARLLQRSQRRHHRGARHRTTRST